MSTNRPDWTHDEEDHVRAAVERRPLPRTVDGYDVEFGEDATGDPAVFVWLSVTDGNPDDAVMREINRYVRDTENELMGLWHWPYIRFRPREEPKRVRRRA